MIAEVCLQLAERTASWLSQSWSAQEYMATPGNLSDLVFGYLGLERLTRNRSYVQETNTILREVLSRQEADGSWREIYPEGSWRSTLATAYIGFNLVRSLRYLDEEWAARTKTALTKATMYVKGKMTAPGYFVKSEINSEDTVNVNMNCYLYLSYSDDFLGSTVVTSELSRMTLKGIFDSQLRSGAFTYYTNKSALVWLTPVYYHTIMMRWLVEYHILTKDMSIISPLIQAANWFISNLDKCGRIRWRGDLCSWAYRNSSTYGFALRSLLYLSKLGEQFEHHAQLVLGQLVELQSKSGAFPTSDSQKTLQDICDDFDNVLMLLSHREFRATNLVVTRTTNLAVDPYRQFKINAELLENLVSSISSTVIGEDIGQRSLQ